MLKVYHNFSISVKPKLFLAQMIDTTKSNRRQLTILWNFQVSQINTATRSICRLLHYLLFSRFSNVPSLVARHPVVAVIFFILLREECSPGSLQHATGTLIIFLIKKWHVEDKLYGQTRGIGDRNAWNL